MKFGGWWSYNHGNYWTDGCIQKSMNKAGYFPQNHDPWMAIRNSGANCRHRSIDASLRSKTQSIFSSGRKGHFGYWDLLSRQRSINATPCNSPLLTYDLLFFFLGKYPRMEHLQRQGCCRREDEGRSGKWNWSFWSRLYHYWWSVYLLTWMVDFWWFCLVNVCKYWQLRQFYALCIVSMAWDAKPLPGCNRGILKPQSVLVSRHPVWNPCHSFRVQPKLEKLTKHPVPSTKLTTFFQVMFPLPKPRVNKATPAFSLPRKTMDKIRIKGLKNPKTTSALNLVGVLFCVQKATSPFWQ